MGNKISTAKSEVQQNNQTENEQIQTQILGSQAVQGNKIPTNDKQQEFQEKKQEEVQVKQQQEQQDQPKIEDGKQQQQSQQEEEKKEQIQQSSQELEISINEIGLKTYSYGVGSGRACSIVTYKDDKVLFPQGKNIVVYNIRQTKRERVIDNVNTSAVYVIRENSKYIFSIDYSGHVVVLLKDTLEKIYEFNSEGNQVKFASVSEEYLVLNNHYYKSDNVENGEKNGLIEIFDLQKLETENKCERVSTIEGNYQYSLIRGDRIISNFQEIQPEKQAPKFVNAKRRKRDKIKNIFRMHLITKESGQEMVKEYKFIEVGQAVYAGSNDKFCVFLLGDGRLLVFDYDNQNNEEQLEPVYVGEIDSDDGTIFTANLQYDKFYICPEEGYYGYLDFSSVEKIKALPETLTKDEGIMDVVNYGGCVFSVENFYQKILVPDEELLVYNEEGLILYSLKEKKIIKQFLHSKQTCVGLTMSPDNSLVATGDICGNLHVYPVEYRLEDHILYDGHIDGEIRCLCWSKCGQFIIIGNMSGNIYKWQFAKENSKPEIIMKFGKCTITCIKLKSIKNDFRYMIGTSEGWIYIYDFDIVDQKKGETLEEKFTYKHQAHVPISKEELGPQKAKQFSTLHKYAEVWNCTWNYSEQDGFTLFGTCSEDQTGRIFQIDEKKKEISQINQFEGQKLAVTCVDWKKTSIGNIFLQCSDDQTIKVYKQKEGSDPSKLEKLREDISTSFIHDWHTLTYLSIQENGKYFAVATQNGYLIIFDFEKDRIVYSGKVHLGGIEGMIWQGDRLVTCSTDCLVCIYQIEEKN